MGVPQVWEVVRECQPDPVPRFPVSTVLRDKRIAIDVYHILFECGFFNRGLQPSELGRPLINLLHRIKELISLDSWFLLVFDGDNKPAKIGRSPVGKATQSVGPLNDVEIIEATRLNDPFLRIIHRLLDMLNVSSVTTTGEGEAFCCYLQNDLHTVDCVWSNDSDCFIFGGTQILRNFSKQLDDVGVTSEHNKYFNKEKTNFITTVDYKDLVDNHGMLNRKQLLLFSVLLGGDYNTGVKGLGKIKSLKIVQMVDPNFSGQFYDIFHDIKESNKEVKQVAYLKFQMDLFHYCQAHSEDLFGRNYTGALLHKDKVGFDGWPTIDIVLHYFRPSMSKTFDPGVVVSTFSNITHAKGYDKINFQELRTMLQSFNLGNITHFDKWFHETMHEMFLLKYILYEHPGTEDNSDAFQKIMKITEEKSSFVSNLNRKVSYWKVRYNTFLNGVEYTPLSTNTTSSPSKTPVHSPTRSPARSSSRSPSKRQLDIMEYPFSMWIDQNRIPDTHVLVQDFQERQAVSEEEERLKRSRKRVSPKKRLNAYKQSNTLDAFFKKSTSPLLSKSTPSRPSTSSISKSRTATLTPVKRQLFVADPEVSEADSSLVITKENDVNESTLPEEEQDDSLVIIDEVEVDPLTLPETTYIRSSPTKRLKMVGTPTQQHTTMTISPSIIRTAPKLSPKKLPFLARSDTFGSKSSKRSLLSAIESEVDQVVREMNTSSSSSRRSSNASTVTITTDSSGQKGFNDSDDMFLEL